MYLYYPGHLGPRPVTELSGNRGILWDAPVKRLSGDLEDAAAYLVDECGFHRAYEIEELRGLLECSKKSFSKLIEAGDLERKVYTPLREGEPEVPVVVSRVRLPVLKSKLDAAGSASAPEAERRAEEEVSHG